jgi:hypothetical protein
MYHSSIASGGDALCCDDSDVPNDLIRDDIEIVRVSAILSYDEVTERRLVSKPLEFNASFRKALLRWAEYPQPIDGAMHADSGVIAVGDVTGLLSQQESVLLLPYVGTDSADHARPLHLPPIGLTPLGLVTRSSAQFSPVKVHDCRRC